MEFAISQPKKWSDCHETKSKHNDWTLGLKCEHPVWPLAMTLTLNFQGQIWNLLYLSQKWSDCHEMKSKHIDWMQGLKYDHLVWPWPWPWPWFFKVKYGICYISQKWSNCHETKSKHIQWTPGVKYDQLVWPWQWPWSLNFQGHICPRLFDHMHGVDQGFSWSNFEIVLHQNGRADWHWRGWD